MLGRPHGGGDILLDHEHKKENRLMVFQAGDTVISMIQVQGRQRLGHRRV